MKPQRIQLSRRKGWRMPPNTVKVDRTTKWGNPFVTGKHADREYCVRLFGFLMGGMLCVSMSNVVAQDESYQYIKRHREKLRGKNLACWCPLTAPCHADVLLELANRAEVP